MVEAVPTAIEAMRPEDWPRAAVIYAEGLATDNATFETEVPTWEDWDSSHLAAHRFVAMRGDEVTGWVAASAVSSRCVYAGVVEDSVYVAESARGQGVGRALLGALVESTEAVGIWTIQAGIFPENEASLRLHAHLGFEVVGRRKRIGRRDGVWRDVILVERRSPVVA